MESQTTFEYPVTFREGRPILRCRTLFISDIHLGSVGCHAADCYRFLRMVECERLYLVGDIIDGWVGSRDGKWTQEHNNILRHLLGRSKAGPVYFCPGNHDSFMRGMIGTEMGNVIIEHSYTHETLKGKKLLVVHSDLYDKTVTKYKRVAYVGAWTNEVMSHLNVQVNKGRRKKEKDPIHFSSATKGLVKNLIKRGTGYEDELIADTKEAGYDGVVCGHTHKPMVEERPGGFVYVNTGDWTDNCTAVIEDLQGELKLIRWADLKQWVEAHRKPSAGKK